MIKIDRGKYQNEPPDFTREEPFIRAQEELKAFYLEGGGQFSKQSRLDVKYLMEPLIRPIAAYLSEVFHNKCAYTEQRINDFRESNLHFHRPVRDALDMDGQVSPEHYWWLMLDWRNWYLAEESVQRNAANFFPVFGERCEVGTETLDDAVLLDPCTDNPIDYLRFEDDGTVRPQSWLSGNLLTRAEATIRTFGLNDVSLIVSRSDRIKYELERISQSKQALQHYDIPADQEYAACLRQILVRHIADNESDFLSDDRFSKKYSSEIRAEFEHRNIITGAAVRPDAAEEEAAPQIFRHESIQHIEIRNFKGIEHLDLSLVPLAQETADTQADSDATEPANKLWTVFLGENGCGKSSILQAIAWALAYTGSESSRKILGNDAELFKTRYLRRGTDNAEVSLWFGKTASVTLSYDADQPHSLQRSLTSDSQFQVFVRAYGATRLGGADPDDPNTFAQIRIMNILEPDAKLIRPEKWLMSLDEGAFNRAAATLLQLMPQYSNLSPDDNQQRPIRIENDEVMVYEQPLSFVSDGYRAIITLACDIMAGLAEGFSHYDSAPGIVLIDEIGAHLHPRWRMKIVKALKNSFPNLQFIVSTHEPLCLRGLRKGEVIRVRKVFDDNDLPEMQVERILRNPSKLRVDQLLTSEFFGLDSTIDPSIDALFGEYYKLLAKKELSQDEQTRRRELKDQLYGYNTLGFTRRDRMIYELIDQHLADHPLDSSVADLKPETREEILDILKGNIYFKDRSS